MPENQFDCDILIAGGSAGGTAAALAAASTGVKVILLEETDWLGGQLTAQGVCTPDEQQHIETFGGTRRYYAFRNAVRDYYRNTYRLTPDAQAREAFNPGNCWVSRLSYEPKVGAAILKEMVRPLEEADSLRVFYRTRVTALEMQKANPDLIATVIAQTADGEELRFSPKVVLDATDTGDLLPMCGEEGKDWIIGGESRAQTGEPDAPESARPDWVQPFTFPFALEWSPETADTNVIQPPDDYEELKALQTYHIKHGAITGLFRGSAPWWKYRRILAAENFDDPRIPNDIAMINTAGNDYYGGNILGANAGTPEQQAETLARARRVSLGYVYWLQTECPREDDASNSDTLHPTPYTRTGYPEFRLRTDIFDTSDGCSIKPYIRESRRILAMRPILEQEIVVRDFQGNVCLGDNARASTMNHSIGIGHYALDIHPNGHGEPNHFVPTRPFQIPLGALIPKRLGNLLPACKNIGTTHLTNGAYRLHPIEWNIGESAGLLASWCIKSGKTPRAIYFDDGEIFPFQKALPMEGIPLHWFVDVPLDHPAFEAVQWLAGFGTRFGNRMDLLFKSDAPLNLEDWKEWCYLIGMTYCYPKDAGTEGVYTRADGIINLFREYEPPIYESRVQDGRR